MDSPEKLARDLCHRRGVDPDSLADIDGFGTMRPYWTVWQAIALGDAMRAADEARAASDAKLAEAYRQGWIDGAAAAIAS